MKYLVLVLLLFFTFYNSLRGQTKAELEEQRKKTLSEIAYVDNLLKTTEKEMTQSMNAIQIIANKLILREQVIIGMQEEISLFTERINLNTMAIEMMESDLVDLKKDYEMAVINIYRSQKGFPEIVYILSAKDFNQGYKRIKYLQQMTKFRRREAEIIIELKEHIESSKKRLQDDRDRISDLKSNEEQQKSLLQGEQERKQRMVRSLSSKEKQLREEYEEKKRIAENIENAIARIIEEERRREIASDITPEMRLIGESFIENKGRLPWPVEKGVITSHYGLQDHAVLKNVTENNIGIEITSSGKTIARSVFDGEVTAISPISGANITVMIKHGKYITVYTNIVNVKVKKGDKVTTKQEIGDVYSDNGDGNNSVLRFMICDPDFQDPEIWISKK